MSNEKDTGDGESGINRRTVLKSAAAVSAAGFVGLPSFSGSVVAQPGETLYLIENVGNGSAGDNKTPASNDGPFLFEVTLNSSTNEAELSDITAFPDQITAGHIGATPDGKFLWAIDRDTGAVAKYDVSAGAFSGSPTPIDATEIGGWPGGVVQVAFSPDGTLYFASNDTDNLYKVNSLNTSPSAKSVGDTKIDVAGADIAFAADGTLFLYSNAEGSPSGKLFTVDPSNGAATAVASGSTGENFTGLAVRAAGTGDLVGSTTNPEDEIVVFDRTDGSIVKRFSMVRGGSDYNYDFGDMTVGILDTCTTTLDLCAGQDTVVGTVTVTDDGDELSITYEMDPNEGWLLYETHVDIGDELGDFHTNRGGNPKVGQFDLSETHDGVTEFTYTVDCDDEAMADVAKNADTLYIAAHAVVANPGMETSSNLVVNGGFEEPDIVHDAHWNVFGKNTTPTLPGWTVEWSGTTTSFGGLTRPEPQLEIQEEGIRSGWTATEGNQWAELDTDWDGPDGSVSGEPSNVNISQDISTSETFYKLSYSYSPRPGVEKNFLDVFWDGVKIASHTADGSSNSTTDWTDEEIVVQASDSDTVLAFAEKLEETAEADSLGMFLDDVKLVEIREETAWVCEDEETATSFEGSNWATYFIYDTCASFADCGESGSNGGE